MYSSDMKSVFFVSVGLLWIVDAKVSQESKYPVVNKRLTASAKELLLYGSGCPSYH